MQNAFLQFFFHTFLFLFLHYAQGSTSQKPKCHSYCFKDIIHKKYVSDMIEVTEWKTIYPKIEIPTDK